MKKRILLSLFGAGLVSLVGLQAQPLPSLTLFVNDSFPLKENGELAMVQGFQQVTGIPLRVIHPMQSQYEYLASAALHSRPGPDVMLMTNSMYLKYAHAGFLTDLTDWYEGARFRPSVTNSPVIDSVRIGGRLYGLPLERGNGLVTYVRGDWLDKLKMRLPQTFDEYLAMLRAFKFRNPDGLPPEKVIALSAAGLMGSEFPTDQSFREFYQDATPDFVQVGGRWVDGMAEPHFSSAVERLRAAYAEGLIDREVLLNKTTTVREKWNAGLVGVYSTWAGPWAELLRLGLAPNVPQARVVALPPLEGVRYIERPPTVFVIPKSVKNPRQVFDAWFETVLDGGRGQRWATFGPEGIFHRIDRGQIHWLPSIQDPSRPFVKAFLNSELPVNSWNPPYTLADPCRQSLKVFQSGSSLKNLIPFTDESLESVAALNLIRIKHLTRMVTGEVAVNEGLIAYKKEATSLVRAILHELEEVH